MKTITVIILYDDSQCEHYVGAADGPLSVDEQARVAAGLNASVVRPDSAVTPEGGRAVAFREIELVPAKDGLLADAGEDLALVNIWP